MEETLGKTVEKLRKYFPDDWNALPYDPTDIRNKIREFSRKIDPRIYEEIQKELGFEILRWCGNGSTKISFVVDSNIIIQDSFRVSQGKDSSTHRIFSSPFLRLIAPSTIESEVYSQIEQDLPKKCSLTEAMSHAKRLLSKVEIVDEKEIIINTEDLKYFQERYQNDVSFLKVALHFGVKGVISKDKAFDDSVGKTQRYDLGAAVGIIISVEAGVLTLTALSAGTYIGAESLYWLFFFLYKAIFEIFKIVAMIASFGIAGISKLIEITPRWVWYILSAIAIGVGISALISPNFRKTVSDKATDLYNWIVENSNLIIKQLEGTIMGLVDSLMAFKDHLGPYFFVVILGLMSTFEEMQESLK